MKKILLCILFLFSLTTFAQNNIDRELLAQTPNCENVAFNSSRLIDRYFEGKNYDSIGVVCNRWEEFCGTSEPLFRLKVLQQIQSKAFSEEWMNKDYLLNFVFLYQDRLDYSKEQNYKEIYERYKISFGYISLNSPFDDLTVVWASSLLENVDLKPIERAFCLLYSNQSEAFWQILHDQQVEGTKVHETYDKLAIKTKRMAEGNLGFMTGVMLPFGNLADNIGVKSIFGTQFGMKKYKMQFDLSFLFRAGKAKQEYLVIYQGEPQMTKVYLGTYIGLDLAYELWKQKRNEFNVLSGIAFDGFDAIKGDVDNDVEGLSIFSTNWNLGIGYRLYSKKNTNYLGLQAKYNFVNYQNPGGTDLEGDYVSLILTANMFGNARKNSNMKKLKLK